MKNYIFLVVNVALTSALSINNIDSMIEDVGAEKDIPDINHEDDDILKVEKVKRSAIINKGLYWTSPVPYVLEKDLDMNAKGVILRAFDQFRLKSCIDFTPRTSEDNYLSIRKLGGCFSYIGHALLKGQVLSIGQYCDTISTVEHEVLHALGFYHEQSRYDRDDYVTIKFENILEGRERNFDKVNEEESTTNGVPYDYWSVMHYGENAFTNGNGTTIETTKNNSEFQSIIGQRLEMSSSDVLELNLLYQCNSTVALTMHCSFSDATMCQMTRCSQSNNSWKLVKSAVGGPDSDHTSLPTGSHAAGEPGYFMHVSTASGQEGDSARLETKRMRLNRECRIQCLQFYYFHSGNLSDVLNIWLREFHNEMDLTGQRRLVGQITGPPSSYWQIHHVSLNASTFFQVEFEVRKGTGNSSGGISIDDINLSEVECPHVTMQIDDFENVLSSSRFGSIIYSPRQYSTSGYAYRVGVSLYKAYAGVFVQMLSGEYDEHLEWPVSNRQVTFMNVDQDPNIQQQMSKQRSITADPTATSFDGTPLWANPRESGNSFVDENNQTVFYSHLIGRSYFVHFPELTYRSFLKGNSTVFTFSFHDLTPVVNGSDLPCPVAKAGKITHPPTDQDQAPCSARIQTTSSPHHTTHHPHSTEDPPMTEAPPTTEDPEPSERPTTTDDPSIFGNSPSQASSSVHILILLSALLLLIP